MECSKSARVNAQDWAELKPLRLGDARANEKAPEWASVGALGLRMKRAREEDQDLDWETSRRKRSK